eukprot:5531830-Prymnesium_polylepis.1
MPCVRLNRRKQRPVSAVLRVPARIGEGGVVGGAHIDEDVRLVLLLQRHQQVRLPLRGHPGPAIVNPRRVVLRILPVRRLKVGFDVDEVLVLAQVAAGRGGQALLDALPSGHVEHRDDQHVRVVQQGGRALRAVAERAHEAQREVGQTVLAAVGAEVEEEPAVARRPRRRSVREEHALHALALPVDSKIRRVERDGGLAARDATGEVGDVVRDLPRVVVEGQARHARGARGVQQRQDQAGPHGSLSKARRPAHPTVKLYWCT